MPDICAQPDDEAPYVKRIRTEFIQAMASKIARRRRRRSKENP